MLSTATILGITNWCLIAIAILIYVVIFLLMLKSRRELRDVSLLLTCNTCLSAFLLCIAACIMISSNLSYGFLTYNMHFCYTWGLFYDMFECSVYYSYCLQGFYRLCRIVFYKKKFLLSYSLYTILILSQWIVIIALLLPPVLINWYIRLPTEKYCLIPYTYIGPETYHILLLYLIPLICLSIIYIWITTHMRQTSRVPTLIVAASQRQRNQRDVTVIKRILILITMLIILRFPTVIFMIHGAIIGSLYPLTYGIVGLITSVCLILIGIITINITSQLRKEFLNLFFHQNNRVHTEPMALNQMRTPTAAIANVNASQRSKNNDVSLEQTIQ